MKHFKEMMSLVLGVLKDYRVIITLIAFLLVIMIAGFIANYTKKPPKPKKKKNAPIVVQPQPEAQTEESAEAGEEEATE
ncbi:MAG: hypothetical protein MJ181_09360 [Treponema sp.]|nr:hypothetical protein [Treponema sp.]